MKTITLSPLSSLHDAVRDVERDEDVLVMRDGRAVALITAFDDEDLAWYARERDPAFIDSIARARQQVLEGNAVSHEDLRRQLNLE